MTPMTTMRGLKRAVALTAVHLDVIGVGDAFGDGADAAALLADGEHADDHGGEVLAAAQALAEAFTEDADVDSDLVA